jgi:hypothetical protein
MPRRDHDSDLDDMPRRRARRRGKPQSNWAAFLVVGVVVVAILVMAGLTIAGYYLMRGKPAALANTAGATDMELLAGKWECTFRHPNGEIYMHKVKDIVGTTETATWYRPDGSIFRVNRVEFQLENRNGRKVFRYFNGWAIDAVGVGQPFPPGEYAYTLEGDTWTELDPMGTIVWTKKR